MSYLDIVKSYPKILISSVFSRECSRNALVRKMLSNRNFDQVMDSVLSESTENEMSHPSDSTYHYPRRQHCQHSVEESLTESESVAETDDDSECGIVRMSTPSRVLEMGPPPPPRVSVMRTKRGPYRTRPKLRCKTDGCGSLTTSARSTLCLRHKEARRRIRNQCSGAMACTFPVPGSRCTLIPFRNDLCQTHHRITRILKKG